MQNLGTEVTWKEVTGLLLLFPDPQTLLPQRNVKIRASQPCLPNLALDFCYRTIGGLLKGTNADIKSTTTQVKDQHTLLCACGRNKAVCVSGISASFPSLQVGASVIHL